MSCMSRGRRSAFQRNNGYFQTKNMQQLYCNRYFNYFLNIYLQSIEYENLPDEILPQAIERYFFDDGKCLFLRDDVVEMYAVMRVNMGGMPDIYNIPPERYAYANRYFHGYDKTNSVLGFDTYTDYPMADMIYMHANSLALMRMTRDINIFAQRTPVIIASSADSNITTSNILNNYAQFVPFLQLDGKFVEDLDKNMRSLDLKTPVVFDKLEVEMQKEKSAALTLMGVDSNAVDKSERMITNEVNGNNGEIEANRNARLSLRKRWVDQINKMFGLNIKVRFRTAINIADNVSRETLKGGEGDINIHDVDSNDIQSGQQSDT